MGPLLLPYWAYSTAESKPYQFITIELVHLFPLNTAFYIQEEKPIDY